MAKVLEDGTRVSVPRPGRITSIKIGADAPPMLASVAYNAAGLGRRGATWLPTRASVNTINATNLDTLRSRSRGEVRNNPHAGSAVDALVSNVVGTGVRPYSLAPDGALRDAIRDMWADWCMVADADRRCDFYGLQSLVMRSVAEGGEVLVRFRRRSAADGLAVPLQLQLLEAEHLQLNLNRALPRSADGRGGGYIRSGVEFNAWGQRVAYWVLPKHPGEGMPGGGSAANPVRIPAREMLQVFDPLRPGQVRGVPMLSKVLTRLYELDQYADAELVRKKTAALYAAFVMTDPDADAAAMEKVLGSDHAADDDTGSDEDDLTLEPGTVQRLPAGHKIEFSEPADVGGSYEAWVRWQLLDVAVGAGVTYEQLTGDLKGVNYSSIRAGLLEVRRRMEAMQARLIVVQLTRPVWRRVILTALQVGRLPVAGFAEDPERFYGARFVGQGWEWVDPLKEVNAAIRAIRGGLDSRAEAAARRGYDVTALDDQIARDNERADDLGLVLDSDARKTTAAGLTPTGATDDDEAEAETETDERDAA